MFISPLLSSRPRASAREPGPRGQARFHRSGSRIFRCAKFRDDTPTSQLPLEIGLHGAALETGDGGGGIELVGTVLLAALVRMAGRAAAVRRDGGKAVAVAGILDVVDEGPGAIEGGGAEIVLVPAHGIAGGKTYRAVDALDGRVGRDARRGGGLDPLDGIGARLAWAEHALGGLPLLEELAHIARQILDHRQVRERPDLDLAFLDHLGGVRAAGPAWPAVDGHGAGPAHADAAGEAIAEGRVGMTLHPGHHIEHGLVGALRHAENLVAAVLAAAPERDLDGSCHARNTLTYLTF